MISTLIAGLILAAIQFAAALPWLWAVDPKGFARTTRSTNGLLSAGGALLAFGGGLAAFIGYKGDAATLEWYGRYVYAPALHLQLLIDLFLLMPVLLTRVWPKGGAVAYAAYKESLRQPTYWLI